MGGIRHADVVADSLGRYRLSQGVYEGAATHKIGGQENISIIRSAELVVAASDSSTVSIAESDYTCDGTADDVQLQAAIDAAFAAKGGDVYCHAGTYYISATVVVKDGVSLSLSKGTIFKPSADVNMVQMYRNSQVTGGLFDARGTFTKACIYLTGEVAWHQDHNTLIDNVRFWGDTGSGSGTAIHFYADLSTDSTVLVGVSNIIIYGFEYGIYLETANAAGERFHNGHRFYNIKGDATVNFIVIANSGGSASNALAYNNFYNCLFECRADSLLGFYSDGVQSIVDIELIDEGNPTGAWKNISLTASSKRNVINYLGYSGYESNLGTWNTLYRREQASAKPRYALGGELAVNDGEIYVSGAYGLRIDNKNYTASGAMIIQGFATMDALSDLAMTLANPGTVGKYLLINQQSAAPRVHTVTTATAGGFDGTNNTATFNAADDTLFLVSISATRWFIIQNLGVVLSAV